MFSTRQIQDNDKTSTQPWVLQPAAESLKTPFPETIGQRAKLGSDPKTWPQKKVLQLHRVFGNQAVGKLLSGGGAPPAVQAQFTGNAFKHPPHPVIQRHGLDKLAEPKVNQLEGQEIALQDNLMQYLNQQLAPFGAQAPPVLRMCTLELGLNAQQEIIGNLTAPILPVPKGLTPGYPLIASEPVIQAQVAQNVINTLRKAGQLEYLVQNNLLNNPDWRIIVDVDFYYERPKDAVGFHKDTVGRSLFVNLNFNNETDIVGPEYILNPPPIGAHDKHIAPKLPEPFLRDLVSERQRLGAPTEIGATMVKPKGIVSFVDELIHHSTPYLDHRGVSGRQLHDFLVKYASDYSKVRTAYLFTTLLNTHNTKVTSTAELLAMGLEQRHIDYLGGALSFTTGHMKARLAGNPEYEGMKQLVATQPVLVDLVRLTNANGHFHKEELVKAGMPLDAVNLLFKENMKPDMDVVGLSDCEDHCDVDVNTKGYPILDNPLLPKLTRRMSQILLAGQLPPPTPDKRQFFRTWVQAIHR